jgi:hypothetical protein
MLQHGRNVKVSLRRQSHATTTVVFQTPNSQPTSTDLLLTIYHNIGDGTSASWHLQFTNRYGRFDAAQHTPTNQAPLI